jgi:predicted phosphodiesterase
MAGYHLTDAEFITEWNNSPSAVEMAKKCEINIRNLLKRRRAIESRNNIVLVAKGGKQDKLQYQNIPISRAEETPHHARREIQMEKGRVVVFSDAHFWPDDYTTAYKALLMIIKEFRPRVVIANGDVFDGSQASRHPRIGWSNTPTIKEELEACKEFMGNIEKASIGAELIWTLGNHDARFETFLAAQASQYEGVEGFTLKDHFPLWKPCWSYWVNSDTMIKHRWKGGFSAGRANSLNAGVNIITGHTHNLAVQPITDFSPAFRHNGGTRYGVQTGTLAEPNSEQFVHYTEDNPKDWRSGFALLSFERGRLMLPELIQVCGEDEFEFRGCINKV